MQPVWDLPLQPAGISIELPGGELVRIRPVRADDIAGIQAAYQNLSPESRYFRFFTARARLSDDLATSLTDIDHETHFAWAVFDPERASEVQDASGFAVGSARLIQDPDTGNGEPTSAEAALAIVDEYQGRGIGRFLIDLLLATASDNDIEILRFEIMRQNRGMIGLIASMGGEGSPVTADPTVVEYRLTVPSPDDSALPAGALYGLLRHLGHDDAAEAEAD